MSGFLAEVCKETNTYWMVAGAVSFLILEWWLPRSRLKASSTVELVWALIAFIAIALALSVTGLFRRKENDGTTKSSDPGKS